MGCDIHTIIEVKQDGKWKYIPELPDTFNDRCYGVFSILNRNVRNYNGRNGFEGNGIPTDISGKQFRFVSQYDELFGAYNNKSTFVCWIDEKQSFISPYDESLKTEIDAEFYEELKSGMTEKQKSRYYMPVQTPYPQKYFVQDANKVNGEFVNLPFTFLYKTLKEFNDAYYKFEWHENEKDYGYYEVDFESNDFHSHSHLTLAELKTKVVNATPDKEFIVEKDFITCLENEIGEFPETMVVEDLKDNKVKVSFGIDPDDFYPQESYNKGVKELEDIKEKYNVKSDEDLRIVFAFDS